jgi:pilus assembly protein CpaE
MAKVPSVLVVDENEDSRVELRKLLARAGFTVAGMTRYGASASATAEELQPDAVLIAIEEPPNRALETVETLAQLMLETPLIGYSAVGEAGAVRRAVRAGVRDYLVRPLDADALREAIYTALEQEEQRQLRRAGQVSPAVRGTVITVTGAKGGVGKSVVAINLALALRAVTGPPRGPRAARGVPADLGPSVVLVDGDTHFGDVATMLNIAPEPTVTRVAAQIARYDRATIVDQTVEHPSGLRVLPGPTEPEEWHAVTAEGIERLIALLAQAFDFVVIDTADVFDPVVEQCVQQATLTLLVTSLDLSSIADTKVALRIFRRWDTRPEKVRLTVNLTRHRDGVREPDVQQALGWPVFWSVPHDRRVPDAAQLGESLVLTAPKAAFTRSFRDLAAAISGQSGAAVARGAPRRRLFGLVPMPLRVR